MADCFAVNPLNPARHGPFSLLRALTLKLRHGLRQRRHDVGTVETELEKALEAAVLRRRNRQELDFAVSDDGHLQAVRR